VPLLVGPPHQAEVVLEQVMTLEPQKRVGHLAAAAARDLGDGDLRVVIADPAGYAAEEGEGPDVPLEERLGAFAREGTEEESVGVRQGHHEQGHSGRLAVERDLGLAEVDLGLTGAVGQGNEDLGGSQPAGGDGLLHDGQAARVPVLVAEPLEDAVGGVPLFLRGLLVILEDLLDDGKERLELRLRSWRLSAVAGGLGVLEDLLESVPVDVVLAAGAALAQAVDEDATADLGPGLHVCVHP